MAKSLTEKAVTAAKPNPDKRLEIPDGLLTGFYLVVQPKGAKSWAVRYRYAGRSKKMTIGGYPAFSLQEARRKARTALRAVAEGNDPSREQRALRQGELIEDIAEDFMKRHVELIQEANELAQFARANLSSGLSDPTNVWAMLAVDGMGYPGG